MRINHVIARAPQFLRRAVGGDSKDGTRIHGGKQSKWGGLLLLRGWTGLISSRADCNHEVRRRGCFGGHGAWRSLGRSSLLTHRGDIKIPIRGHQQRGDFFFGGLVQDEGSPAGSGLGNAQNPPTGFGTGQNVSFRVERQRTDMSFFAGIKNLALAVRRDRENLSGVAGRYVKRSVLIGDNVPDVFHFRVEKNGRLACRGDFIYFSVRRGAYEQISRGIERQGLCGQFRGFEHTCGFAGCVNAQHLCVRTSRRVKISFGIRSRFQEIAEIGVGKFGEARREENFSVAAQCHALGGAFVKIFEGGLTPPACMFGDSGSGNRENYRGEEQECARLREVRAWRAARVAGIEKIYCA